MPTTHMFQNAAPQTKTKVSTSRKWTKRLFYWLFGAIGLLLLTAVVIAAFFEKQIGERLITEINKGLKSELSVEDFDLSLLSGFPDASANLQNVVLKDHVGGTLLETNKLSFEFGLFSLFGSNIKVHTVSIEDGALFIKINKKGIANYDIIKKSTNTSKDDGDKEEGIAISIEEAKLENVEVIYIDKRVKQTVKLQVREAVASGKFSSSRFALNSFATMKSNFVEIKGQRSMVGKDMMYDAKIDVDMDKGIYTFDDVDFGVESNVFKINGQIATKKKDTDFDLIVTSEECNLQTMLGLMPDEYLDYFSDFKSKGTFLFDAKIKGRLNDKLTPGIDAKFGLTKGKISSPKLGHELKDVTFTARFQNGKDMKASSSIFEIKDFKGYFNRELVQSSLRIVNLDSPIITFGIDGVLPLNSVYGLLDNPNIKKGDGELEIKNLKIKGRYKDMITPGRIGKVKANGVIEFDDASLTINKETLIVDRGSLIIKDNSLKVNKVKIEGAGSEIYLNGKFLDFLPVLFADETNSKDAELKFKASLDAPHLDIDRLIRMTESQQELAAVKKGFIDVDSIYKAHTLNRERITKFLKGTFQAKIDEFNYNYIKGTDFSGNLTFDNNELLVKGHTNAMDGTFGIDGKMFFKDEPSLQATLDVDDINVRTFFQQTENMGLEVLQYKNIKGRLTSKVSINAFWDKGGSFLDKKLKVLGDVNIKNGELIRLNMFYAFADYIKLSDLKHIKFTKLHNYFEVKKGKVYIPEMFIQSNALNLTISGIHSFENRINYNIKVNAGQVIGNLFKRHDSTRKPIEAKKKGWFNLYYRVYGTVDKYTTKRDKSRVKKNLKSSSRHRKEIQYKLKREFGTINKRTVPDDLEDENENIDDPIDASSSDEGDDEFIEGFEADNAAELEEIERKKVTKEANKKKVTPPPPSEVTEDEEYIDWEEDGR